MNLFLLMPSTYKYIYNIYSRTYTRIIRNPSNGQYRYYLSIKYYFTILLLVMFTIEISKFKHLHIIYIHNYCVLSWGYFPLVVIVLILAITLFIECIIYATLEVHASKDKALSLYYWQGFQLLYKRNAYYDSLDDGKYLSYSAYTLINTKIISKNTLRRCLLIFSLYNMDMGMTNSVSG